MNWHFPSHETSAHPSALANEFLADTLYALTINSRAASRPKHVLRNEVLGEGVQTSRPFDSAQGRLYYYWLEDVDVNRGSTLHGPVSVTVNVPTAVTLHSLTSPNPSLLKGLIVLVVLGLWMLSALKQDLD